LPPVSHEPDPQHQQTDGQQCSAGIREVWNPGYPVKR